MFNSYSKMIERSINQYVNFSKILQDSVNTAIDINLKASKNYTEWMLENNPMKSFIAPSLKVKPQSAEKKPDIATEAKAVEVQVEVKADTEATVNENKLIKKGLEKKKTKNALYQV